MDRPLSDHPGDEDRLDILVQAAHDAHVERLVVSTSGNISVRLRGELFAISAARCRLGRLEPGQAVAVGVSDGEYRPGALGESADVRPSRETPMHAAIYRARPEIGGVIHCQSVAATVLACRKGPQPNLAFIPELPVHVRKIARVLYLPPGSVELAAAAAKALEDEEVTIVQLSNHGQIVVGSTPAQAVERATFFELACRMALISETRQPLRVFTPAELEVLASY